LTIVARGTPGSDILIASVGLIDYIIGGKSAFDEREE
jgi:hypothetical protein